MPITESSVEPSARTEKSNAQSATQWVQEYKEAFALVEECKQQRLQMEKDLDEITAEYNQKMATFKQSSIS